MAKKLVKLDVNGETHEIAVEPNAALINSLRDQVGLVGPKRGCDSGGCGCCSVVIDGAVHYSCMVYTCSVEGSKITTVEGLVENGKLSALQRAFVEKGAVQCGYCTCGIIMAAHDLLTKTPDADEEEIRKGISGNLCRCTGYHKIVEAIKSAAPEYQAA